MESNLKPLLIYEDVEYYYTKLYSNYKQDDSHVL